MFVSLCRIYHIHEVLFGVWGSPGFGIPEVYLDRFALLNPRLAVKQWHAQEWPQHDLHPESRSMSLSLEESGHPSGHVLFIQWKGVEKAMVWELVCRAPQTSFWWCFTPKLALFQDPLYRSISENRVFTWTCAAPCVLVFCCLVAGREQCTAAR